MGAHRLSSPFLALLAVACLTACSFTASHAAAQPEKQASYAIEPDFNTVIGKKLAPGMQEHPGQSAFRLLTHGSDAFFARVALIRHAQKSLDFQYYIVEDDLTGSMLLEEILRAADRGVRVRLLVDSMAVSKVSQEVSLMLHHPQIAIRVFNPVALKRHTILGTAAAWVFDFDRANSRMHNKALIADNLAAIIGGRNLGDQYFDASSDFFFSDMDVVAAGPIVRHISRSFDYYWNSKETNPLSDVEYVITDAERLKAIRRELGARWEKAANSEAGQNAEAAVRLWNAEGKEAFPFVWAHADLAVDSPDKVNDNENATAQEVVSMPAAAARAQETPAPAEVEAGEDIHVDKQSSEPLTRLDTLVAQAKESFTIINAYVVPRDSGVEWLAEQERRGVEVRILTNSLDSTDVAAVHSGYERYRPALLHNGVELYELKAIEGKRTRQNLFGSVPRSSLHAKTFVVDGEHVVVASFNLDPRSIEDNTELALTIHSRKLAQQALKMFKDSTQPERSYHVRLANPDDKQSDALEWVTVENGREVVLDEEPDASFWRETKMLFYRFLPIEDLL